MCWVQVRGLKALCEHYSSESGYVFTEPSKYPLLKFFFDSDVEKALSLISSLYLVHNNTSTTLLSDFEPIMSQVCEFSLNFPLLSYFEFYYYLFFNIIKIILIIN